MNAIQRLKKSNPKTWAGVTLPVFIFATLVEHIVEISKETLEFIVIVHHVFSSPFDQSNWDCVWGTTKQGVRPAA